MEQFPNEIFRIIFLLSILEDPRPTGYNGLADAEGSEGQTWPSVFRPSKGPWAITRVNRKWRTISTTFPQLWSQFSLTASDLEPPVIDGAAALTTWLSFSGTSNLSFFIQPDGICNDSNHSSLFELLINRADRWEKIEFYNSTSTFWSMLHARGVRSRLGSLKSVTIHSEEANIANEALSGDPAHYQVLLDAPRLQTVINRNHLPVAGLELPWTQLKEYEGSHRVNVDDHLQLLRRTPNLEKCRLTVAYVSPPPDQTQPESSQTNSAVLLPLLQTLQVRTTWFSDSIRDLPASIRRFRLPALKTLHVVSEHLSPTPPPLSAFAEVIRSSDCELHSLELSSRGDTILPRLDPEGRSQDELLVPVLESLELRFPSPSAIPVIDLAALSTAIRSRSKASVSDSGNGSLNNDVLTSAFRVPIMEVLGEAEIKIVIETRNTAKR
ncbi:hypothetical protein L218DRAFT_988052 [Marasmius fiardii PR-910]|nr:hypothetical protein L218DRAFT_988052 [Marasmius fiardii PR-910]